MRRLLLLSFCGLLISLVFCLPKSFSDSPIQNSEFVYARIRYHMTSDAWRVREVPWYHDYPYADEIFPTVLGEVTTVKTTSASYKIVDIDSPELFDYPFAYLCEPGYLELNEKDVVNLRSYLDLGGFFFLDRLDSPDFFQPVWGETEVELREVGNKTHEPRQARYLAPPNMIGH